MTDAHDLGGKIRAALYGVIDHYVAALPLGVKAINSGGMPGSASKSAPPPVPLGNLDARIDCHRDLHFWCRFVMGEIRDVNGGQITTRVDALDPIALARFLVVWADQLARLDPEEAANCAREMDGHAVTLKSIVYDLGSRRFPVGTCPEHGTSEAGERVPCPGNLKAVLPKDEDQVSSLVCTADPMHNWSAAGWMQLGKRINAERTA